MVLSIEITGVEITGYDLLIIRRWADVIDLPKGEKTSLACVNGNERSLDLFQLLLVYLQGLIKQCQFLKHAELGESGQFRGIEHQLNVLSVLLCFSLNVRLYPVMIEHIMDAESDRFLSNHVAN
jgi:hypothetical protein